MAARAWLLLIPCLLATGCAQALSLDDYLDEPAAAPTDSEQATGGAGMSGGAGGAGGSGGASQSATSASMGGGGASIRDEDACRATYDAVIFTLCTATAVACQFVPNSAGTDCDAICGLAGGSCRGALENTIAMSCLGNLTASSCDMPLGEGSVCECARL